MCKIRTLTHLSENDIEWIGLHCPDDTFFFKNAKGIVDTMSITRVSINNSSSLFMNPFLKFETGADYIAYACVFFSIRHNMYDYDCSFFIYKDYMDVPPFASWRFGNLISNEHIPTDKSDCIFGGLMNSMYVDNNNVPKDSLNYIVAFEWCKRMGLKSYTLKTGEVYQMEGNKNNGLIKN